MARKDENLSPEEEQLRQLKADQKAFKKEQKTQRKEAKKRAKELENQERDKRFRCGRDDIYHHDMAWNFVSACKNGRRRVRIECPYTDAKGCTGHQ